MQSYCYHLKFELYALPDPSTKGEPKSQENPNIWLPQTGASIFDDLPSHPRRDSDNDAHSPPPSTRPEETRDRSFAAAARAAAVIDCGSGRPADVNANPDGSDAGTQGERGGKQSNLAFYSPAQWRARRSKSPPPGFDKGIGPRTAVKDWRFGRVRIESFDRVSSSEMAGEEKITGEETVPVPAASLGPNLGGIGQSTRGRWIPLETKNTEAGWGVVHLYREADEAGALRAVVPSADGVASGSGSNGDDGGDDGTVLCIPAVPSYMSPGDFLGFIGEKWRGDVSHYRMVMTSRLSRYMVLMKFRDTRVARQWREEFDGKPFDSLMESEICHVTFIKSITVEAPGQADSKRKAQQNDGDHYDTSSPTMMNSLKPFPPPTPNLIELPTCPVCLERMDDTAGLMTILCQHVFHCTCLQTWKGSGCPVCRATNPQPTSDPDNPYAQPFGSDVSNLCSVCDSTEDLWICLICGKVGCGRYRGGHAKDHWKDTAHSFSLELETQHVWDYAGDMWVHRLIRDKGDGKVVDFSSNNNNNSGRQLGEEEDVVPRAKLEGIGLEYAHLLTSQLESQRIYFEEMVNKAADKAAKATSVAESASAQASKAMRELATLQEEHRVLKEETVFSLEKDLERERNRANKSAELARNMGRSLQEEKKVSEGLMERIKHLDKEIGVLGKTIAALREENEELREANQDLTMFISGQEKLKELENEGKVDAAELQGGTMVVPEEKKKGKGKGKGKK